VPLSFPDNRSLNKTASAWNVFWIAPAVFLLLLGLFLSRAHLPQGWDDGVHVRNTMAVFHALSADPADLTASLKEIPTKYPPLQYFLASLLQFGLPGTLGFSVFTWLCSLAFIALYYLAARALVRDRRLALIAVLAMLANPIFRDQTVSFNLEMILLASTVGILALVLNRPERSGILTAIFAGYLTGALLLSKAVIIVFILFPLLTCWIAGVARPDFRKRFTEFLGFAAPMIALPAAWFLFKSSSAVPSWWIDLGTAMDKEPWWYYGKVLLMEFAAGPILLFALFGSIRRLQDKPLRSIALPALGTVLGFLFLSVIGTKHAWYALAPYSMMVLTLIFWIDGSSIRLRRVAIPALLILYSLIAMVQWHPHGGRAAQFLSLGSISQVQTALGMPVSYDTEIAAAKLIARLGNRTDPGSVKVISTSALSISQLNKALVIENSGFAKTRWLVYAEENDAGFLIDQTKMLVTFEKTSISTGLPEFANLAWFPERSPRPERAAMELFRKAFEESIRSFRVLERTPLQQDLDLVVYERRAWFAQPDN
jgi:4-amino-4-deoxy-L-arabinose transferase-like glycosyltransferase